MGLSSVQKVSRSGNSLIVNIPKKIADLLGINLGDYIEVDWGEVIKKKMTKKAFKKYVEKEDKLPKLKDE